MRDGCERCEKHGERYQRDKNGGGDRGRKTQGQTEIACGDVKKWRRYVRDARKRSEKEMTRDVCVLCIRVM